MSKPSAPALPPLLADPAIASKSNLVTYSKESDVEGHGVFAKEDIQPGQPWWTFNPTRHILVSKEQHDLVLWAARVNRKKFDKLLDAMHRYCFHSKVHDQGVYCLDDRCNLDALTSLRFETDDKDYPESPSNSRYTNFSSENPNSRPAQGYYSSLSPPIHLPIEVYSHVATTLIPKDSEILENYAEYDGGEWCRYLSGAWVDDKDAPPCVFGPKPSKGRHVIFELDKEQLKVLKESQLPKGPGKAFFDCCDMEGDGAVIAFDVEE